MKLHLFKYVCKNCNTIFKFPQLCGSHYGEFLLKSKTGEIVYLNGIESNIFDEFRQILTHSKKTINQSDIEKARLQHRIFGIACDSSPNNNMYKIGQHPPCPKCKKFEFKTYGPTNPPEIVDLDVSNVTHEKWSKLTVEEKKLRIDEAIDDDLKNIG